MNNQMLNIKDILKLIKKKFFFIVLIILTATIGTALVNIYYITPKYQSWTKLLIGKDSTSKNSPYQSGDIQMYQMLLQTYAGIVISQDVLQGAIDKYGLEESVSKLSSELEVVPGDGDLFLTIYYYTSNKDKAKDTLSCITNEFISKSKELISNVDITIITEANTPVSQLTPNVYMNVLIAFTISVMSAITIVIFLDYLDTSIKCGKDINNISNIKVIGVIPNYGKRSLKREIRKAGKLIEEVKKNESNNALSESNKEIIL